MTRPTIESHENRGDAEYPFGFVYFTDGSRLSFAPGTSGLGNPLGLFPSKGWAPEKVRKAHYEAAAVYLADHGITNSNTD